MYTFFPFAAKIETMRVGACLIILQEHQDLVNIKNKLKEFNIQWRVPRNVNRGKLLSVQFCQIFDEILIMQLIATNRLWFLFLGRKECVFLHFSYATIVWSDDFFALLYLQLFFKSWEQPGNSTLGQSIPVENQTGECAVCGFLLKIHWHSFTSHAFMLQNIYQFTLPDPVTITFFCIAGDKFANRLIAESFFNYQRFMHCPKFWARMSFENVRFPNKIQM